MFEILFKQTLIKFRILFLISFVVFVSSSYAHAEDINGIFMVVKGEVTVIDKDKKSEPAKVGRKVFQGDTISAGKEGRAKIVMSDKNVLNISPDTQIKIEKYENDGKDKKNVELNVLYGKVRASVEQKYDGEKSKFNIKTPSAVAGVRGTDFLTGYNPSTKAMSVITFTGSVAVGSPGPGGSIANPVFVNQGQMTEAKAGATPSKPQTVPKEEMQKMNNETKAETAKSGNDNKQDQQQASDAKKDEKKDEQKDEKKDGDKKADKRGGDEGNGEKQDDKKADKNDKNNGDKADKNDSSDKNGDKKEATNDKSKNDKPNADKNSNENNSGNNEAKNGPDNNKGPNGDSKGGGENNAGNGGAPPGGPSMTGGPGGEGGVGGPRGPASGGDGGGSMLGGPGGMLMPGGMGPSMIGSGDLGPDLGKDISFIGTGGGAGAPPPAPIANFTPITAPALPPPPASIINDAVRMQKTRVNIIIQTPQ